METQICLFALLVFFFFLQFGAAFSSLAQHLCHPDDSLALLQFKETFHINASNIFFYNYLCNQSGQFPYPKISSWNKSRDCCTWDGITCHEMTGHVIGLDLSCSQLEGAISPNSSLFTLSHLQKLNLALNDFKGSQISHGFGGITRLTHLNLSMSNFNGQIASEISHLSKLILLDLSRDVYSLLDLSQDVYTLSNDDLDRRIWSFYYLTYGSIGFGQHDFELLLQNLTHMSVLSLNGVYISSEVPTNLSSSLSYLDLSGTGLHGKLPNDVFQLPKLQMLQLNGNQMLTGSLPQFNCSKSLLQKLDLSFANFSGELPNSIGCLKSLEGLHLENNHFSGPLPESIGNLSKLNSLDLHWNYFTGPLPEPIENLSELNSLVLTGNKFIGPLPESIGNLSKLNSLLLDFNNFIGPLPESIGNLSKLNSLGLSFNNFSGLLPESIGHLSKLSSLYLLWNNFTGSLPESIGNLSKLNYLYLTGNNFRGPFPESIGNLLELNSLNLKNNQLHGSIPNSISKLLNLVDLDLSSNNLSGIVEPNMFSNLKKLQILDLSDNMLIWRIENDVTLFFPYLEHLMLSSCGLKEIPEFLRNSKNLHTLQLSNNNIRQIPTWFSSMPWDLFQLNLSHNSLSTLLPLPFNNLFILDFQSNQLQGPLPLSICNLEQLKILDFSNNKLIGAIPQCFGNFSGELLVLDLKNNSLQGKIALTFTTHCPLRTLDLNGNLLEGPLPRSLSNCGQLEVLDVSNNNIFDTFPTWLENLKELQVLILKSNRFFGPIGTLNTKNPFENLRVIDISSNEFIGVLPTRLLRSFTAMESMNTNESKARYMETDNVPPGYYEASVELATKGQEIEFPKILTILSGIDVSSNRFSGEIPKVIGNLVSLKFLNLSHNQFSGHIPSALGNLSSLESLDISCNHIDGEIPSQLTRLTSLSFLNLSQNHLEGRIPSGPQFDTFSNDSYIGNLGLCGFPLTKSCGETNAPPSLPQLNHQQEEDSNFFSGFTWRPVILGYGCGIVFGLTAGSLMFLIGKPKSIIDFIEIEIFYCGLLLLSKKQVYKRFKRPTRRGHKLKHKGGAHHQSNPHAVMLKAYISMLLSQSY